MSGRRLTVWVALLAVWCAVSLSWVVPPANAASLTRVTWSATKTTIGATAVGYTYTFTTATTSSLSSVTMTVPLLTGGTPTVGTVSPLNIAGGSVTLVGTTLTYSFTPVVVASKTAVSIRINGLTNTTTIGDYTSTITTRTGGSPVDTGTSSTMTVTVGQLTSPNLSVSSTAVGATGVSYIFTFTIATTGLPLGSITMTVPPGTSGTPTLGAVTPSGLGGSISLSGNTLTLSGISYLPVTPTAFSIQVNGLTNTSTAGAYTSEIVTRLLINTGVDSGITPAVSFTGTLNLTSPASLTWSGTLNGADQSLFDGVTADQQFDVDDETGSGAGWHITVAATTFTNGSHTLPDTGTFVFTGSLSSPSATTAPSATCVTSCTPPTDTTTYPVGITTAASSPIPSTVFSTPAGTGLGPATLGGASAPHPIGWWVNVPANAWAGAYTSTVTVTNVSGP